MRLSEKALIHGCSANLPAASRYPMLFSNRDLQTGGCKMFTGLLMSGAEEGGSNDSDLPILRARNVLIRCDERSLTCQRILPSIQPSHGGVY